MKAAGRRQAVWAALKVYFLYILTPSFLMCIGMMLRRVTMTAREFVEESGNFYTVLGFAAALWLLARSSRKRGGVFHEEALLFPGEADKKSLCLLAGTGLAASLTVSSLLTVLPLPEKLMASYGASSGNIFQGTDPVLITLAVLLLAPAAEEIIFRGLIMSRLQTAFTGKQATLLAAFLFAVLHVNPVWMLYSFLMACFLGAIVVRTENTCYCIAFHMGFNLFSLPVALMNGTGLGALVFGSRLLVFLYGCGGAAAAVLLLRSLKQREETKWLEN